MEARDESRTKFQTRRADKEVGNDAGLSRKKGKLTERELCLAFLILGAIRMTREQISAPQEPRFVGKERAKASDRAGKRTPEGGVGSRWVCLISH